MVDLQTVCCMCGDVGFPDKLFRCSKCRNRFQHSYCSNYYSECRGAIEVCDWCQCEERNSHRHGGGGGGAANNISSSSASLRSNNNNNNSTIKSPSSSSAHANEVRSAYSGDKIKQHHREEGGAASEKAAGKTPSPRPTTRRYKLLKDVMC
ncbi:hypothetical protein ABFS83_02G144900 [Erythranthe nasuta]